MASSRYKIERMPDGIAVSARVVQNYYMHRFVLPHLSQIGDLHKCLRILPLPFKNSSIIEVRFSIDGIIKFENKIRKG